jgi:hypothetical protein
MQALIRRAYELRIIVEHQYKYLNIKIRDLGWKKQEPGSEIGTEKPRVLRKLSEVFYGGDLRRLADEMTLPRSLVEAIVGAHATASDLPKKVPTPSDQLKPPPPASGGSLIQFSKK